MLLARMTKFFSKGNIDLYYLGIRHPDDLLILSEQYMIG
jgi:hypothetical protein